MKLNDKLIKILESLSCKQKNRSEVQKELGLSGIEKRMCLVTLGGLQNAAEWLADFESECELCNVTDGVLKVKCM